jgi:hypothetical protein
MEMHAQPRRNFCVWNSQSKLTAAVSLRIFIFTISCLVMSVPICPVRAELLSTSQLRDISGQSQTSIDRLSDFASKRDRHSKILLNLSQQEFPGEGQIETQRKDYTNFGIDMDFRSNSKDIAAAAHGIYQGTMQSSHEQYVAVPELYLGETQSASGVRLTVGRQKRHWSLFDEEFGMGIWQPQLRWDYLNPVQQGLAGIFLDYPASHQVTVSFFASPLFLPDQGPQFKLKDGEFESDNRWFWKPQTKIRIIRQRAPMSYELDKPSAEQVVFQSSMGGTLRWQRGPLWTQFSYAYKPMNQLHLGFECTACIGFALDVHAIIHPSVLMHRVATLETGFEDEVQRGWLSITSDVPSAPKGPTEWVQSSHNSVVFAGASYSHFLNVASRPSWVKLSYLQAYSRKDAQPNSLVDERVESSLDRYPYQQIAAAEWNWLILQRSGRQLGWRSRYNYSIPERGTWVASQLWLQQKEWSWNLGIDIIGADINPTSPDAGLFSRYRANNRATAGVTYVF